MAAANRHEARWEAIAKPGPSRTIKQCYLVEEILVQTQYFKVTPIQGSGLFDDSVVSSYLLRGGCRPPMTLSRLDKLKKIYVYK